MLQTYCKLRKASGFVRPTEKQLSVFLGLSHQFNQLPFCADRLIAKQPGLSKFTATRGRLLKSPKRQTFRFASFFRMSDDNYPKRAGPRTPKETLFCGKGDRPSETFPGESRESTQRENNGTCHVSISQADSVPSDLD